LAVGRQETATILLAALLVGVGALAWVLELRDPLVVDATPLVEFPERIDEWSAVDIRIDPAAAAMLNADWNLHRMYSRPSGEVVWLYVGYYGTQRGGRPEHTPDACYPAYGWTTREQRSRTVPGVPGLRVRESLIEQDGAWQLVQYWFRSARSTGQLDGWDQTVDRFLARLLTGRADGAVVRISTTLRNPDEADAGRQRLLAFAATTDRALADHWPAETPAHAAH
jgi:EpsI family protein